MHTRELGKLWHALRDRGARERWRVLLSRPGAHVQRVAAGELWLSKPARQTKINGRPQDQSHGVHSLKELKADNSVSKASQHKLRVRTRVSDLNGVINRAT